MSKPRTLFDKIWANHLVHTQDDGTCLIYIDRHLVHEVTSPQAFEGLRAAGRKVRRPDLTIAVADHNVPTTDRSKGIEDPESRTQIETLEQNVREFGVPYFAMDDVRQGIVHIIGPEQGMTLLEFATPEETVAAVKNGEAVAVFADRDYLVPMAAESGGSLVLLAEEVALGGGVGLGFRDSDDDLRGKFDAAIKSMKCDGTLDAMIVKEEYFGAAAVTWGDAGKEGC